MLMTLCPGNCKPFIETIEILRISSYTASRLSVKACTCALDKKYLTLEILLFAEKLLHVVGNGCEDGMEFSAWIEMHT